MDAKHRVGLRIRVIRKRRNLSQEALAELIDRSSEAVSNLERGLSTPSFDTLEALSVALGVPISELVAETESENKARVE
jgi:transcriptional regulator with XRE-family HTH domain